MKDKRLRARARVERSMDKRMREEIQVFLRALESYAEQVARQPDITFEEHHARFMRGSRALPQRSRRRN